MSPNYGTVRGGGKPEIRERGVDLSSGIDESIPVYLLQKTSDEIWIEIHLPENYLDIFKQKGEVVRGAAFGMTSEKVVSDEANHTFADHHQR